MYNKSLISCVVFWLWFSTDFFIINFVRIEFNNNLKYLGMFLSESNDSVTFHITKLAFGDTDI